MENNDFDIFELVKLLVKQKIKVFVFTLLFALVFLFIQFILPLKYGVKFISSSTVLEQSELVLKLEQLQNLVVHNADERLAEFLDITTTQAQSIVYIDIVAVKNLNNFVQVEVKTSDENLANDFTERIKYFIESDVLLSERAALTEEQIHYGLRKLNSELDSIQKYQDGGVIILNGNPNIVELLDRKSRMESDLLLFDLFYVHDGYEVVKYETSWLMRLVSAALGGFALAILTVLSMHFIQTLNRKL